MHILRAQGQPKAFSLQSQPKQIFVKPHKKKDQATKDREGVKAGGVRRRIVWRRKALGRKRGIIGPRTLSRACLHVSGLPDNYATYFSEPVGDPHSQLHPKYSPHSDKWDIAWGLLSDLVMAKFQDSETPGLVKKGPPSPLLLGWVCPSLTHSRSGYTWEDWWRHQELGDHITYTYWSIIHAFSLYLNST